MLYSITTEEMLNVQLATKGERFSHRCWPQDVIKAVVITEVSASTELQRIDTNRRRSISRLLSFPFFSTRLGSDDRQ